MDPTSDTKSYDTRNYIEQIGRIAWILTVELAHNVGRMQGHTLEKKRKFFNLYTRINKLLYL